MPSASVSTQTASVTPQIIRALSDEIVAKFQPQKIILFGSHAYGTPSTDSDVDLLVLMDTPLRNRQQAVQIALAIDYHFGLDLLVRNPQEFERRIALGDFFLRDIATKGKVLYERL
jgi:predicted nucleotidyltransferase